MSADDATPDAEFTTEDIDELQDWLREKMEESEGEDEEMFTTLHNHIDVWAFQMGL